MPISRPIHRRPSSPSLPIDATHLRAWGRAVRDITVAVALSLGLLVVATGCDRGASLDDIRAKQAEGKYAETVEPLRALLETRPDDPEVHLLYGRALSWTGDARLAVWSLRKAAEDPDLMVQAQLELAAAAMRGGNWDSAIAAAERVLEDEPDHVVARIARGEAYLGSGKNAELALEDFEVVLDAEPENVSAKASRAAALLLAGRADEAAEALAELKTIADDREGREGPQARLCTTLAVFEAERGETEKAAARFEECLERFPSHAVLLEPAMEFFDAQGQSARATELLERALELVPLSQSYRHRLAERAVARGDLEGAEAILLAATEFEDPAARAAAWTDLTNHYLIVRDDVPAALQAYEEALALADDPSQLAILTHADLLARAGHHERALLVAKTLESDAYRGLIEARVALAEGRPEQALARLEEVLPSWPNNAGARYYAARAAEQMGDFARAIEEYRQAIRSAPDQTEAALRLAKIYLAAGGLANAWTSATQYFRAFPQDPEGVRVLLSASAGSERATLQKLFARLRQTPHWALAVALRADAEARLKGNEAALSLIEEAKAIDLTRPVHAELLRAKVVYLSAAGRAPEARSALDAALGAYPRFGPFHEIDAVLLEAEGASPEKIRAAYEKALELDPKQARALLALGRLAATAGEADQALAFFDRATVAAPEDPTAAREAAGLVQAAGRLAEAEGRYEELLREHPWDAASAETLAQLRLERGVADDRTLELTERALLFGAGDSAKVLLLQVHESRGEKERAAEIARAIENGSAITPRQLDQSAGT